MSDNEISAGVIQINENADDKPKTGEEGAFNLPEEDFIDGRLGITVSNIYLSWIYYTLLNF